MSLDIAPEAAIKVNDFSVKLANVNGTGSATLQASGTVSVHGAIVQLNGCGAAVARAGDFVDLSGGISTGVGAPLAGLGLILPASPTVCSG